MDMTKAHHVIWYRRILNLNLASERHVAVVKPRAVRSRYDQNAAGFYCRPPFFKASSHERWVKMFNDFANDDHIIFPGFGRKIREVAGNQFHVGPLCDSR